MTTPHVPALRVGTPPERPLLVYDGQCAFCRCRVDHLRDRTAEPIDALALQDPEVAARFPELPQAQLRQSVALVEPDGSVWYGAAAWLRARALVPGQAWLLLAYETVAPFAWAADRAYRFVARHRRLAGWWLPCRSA